MSDFWLERPFHKTLPILENTLAQPSFGPSHGSASAPAADSLLTGQVAYWHMTNTADASGNGNTLTNTGGVSFASNGQVGKCATFGPASQLEIANASALQFRGAAFGVGFIWSMIDTENDAFSITTGNNGDHVEYQIAMLGGNMYFLMAADDGDPVLVVQDTNLGTPGNGVRVLTFVWFDPTVGANGTGYVRSAKLSDSALNAAVSSAASGAVTLLGDGDFVIASNEGNTIDEVLILNRILTNAEMVRWFTNVKAGNVPV